MKHFVQLAEHIPVAALREQLTANPDLWGQHGHRKNYAGSPHAEMSDIWVRYKAINSESDFRTNDEHVPVWYPAWHRLPALKPILFGLMALTQAEMLGGVLITRIPPGQGIAPHVDRGWHVEFYDKIYVSVQSAPGAVFGCDADGVVEQLEPRPGQAWLFDNRLNHWVTNASDEDRITLIICVRTELFGRQAERV